MKVLVIDCCPRGDASATRRLYRRYLETRASGDVVETVYLYEEPLESLRGDDILRRTTLAQSGAFDDAMFRYARQFRDAEEIVIAAPYWDLSFPSMLKVYLEHVSVSGVTFGYEGGRPVGYCRAGKIIYFSTCGGFVRGTHEGAEYVHRLAEMLGIPDMRAYRIEGLDIDLAKRETLVEDGIRRVMAEIFGNG